MLELLVPILYHLNLSRSDPAKTGLMHIGFFILLLLSGERNFGQNSLVELDLNEWMDSRNMKGRTDDDCRDHQNMMIENGCTDG